MRWKPFDLPKAGESLDWISGLRTVAGAGDPKARSGIAIHVYTCNKNMDNTCKVSFLKTAIKNANKWHNYTNSA
jgi:homogentisate 1,2-dioxygenase